MGRPSWSARAPRRRGHDRLPRPARWRRDLLQAGPLLVAAGRSAIAGVDDPEGFAATSDEFDQNLADGREPRLAIALTGDRLLAVAADGRSEHDAGLTLWEMADLLVDLGAREALNLDGGSAGVIVSDGARVNTPRDDEGEDMELSSPSVTAIVL
ncbi:MAG TPA: phosphodiester glycosidase family protein [Solirubrobacteraceae bacterium]|nr:phosphodiester glycosidase family protein [Solirubrobacteraceae bacterium]